MYYQRHFPFFDEPELIQAIGRVKRAHGIKAAGRYFYSFLQEEYEAYLRKQRITLSERRHALTLYQRLVNRILAEDVKDEAETLELILEI